MEIALIITLIDLMLLLLARTTLNPLEFHGTASFTMIIFVWILKVLLAIS